MPGTGPLYMGCFYNPAGGMVCIFRTTHIDTHVERYYLDETTRFIDNGLNTFFPPGSAWRMGHNPGVSNMGWACRPSQSLDHHACAFFGAGLTFRCCGHFRTACRRKERRKRRGAVEPHRDVPTGDWRGNGRFGPDLDISGSHGSSEV